MIENKKFTKKKEDFNCEKCGFFVEGDGYTNHCPKCLWSKHVDINPGDRAEDCKGMMEPIKTELDNGENYIIQRCNKCGIIKRFKIKPKDDFDKFIEISSKSANIQDVKSGIS